ncbi:hypothetical protein ABZ412_01560 [Nocardia sp. NPDC005746]|uniref:hypothetical protein n=1 Tax=unclassified Nocardia TaxID=2637762 RepID=UPI0033D3DAEC
MGYILTRGRRETKRRPHHRPHRGGTRDRPHRGSIHPPHRGSIHRPHRGDKTRTGF